MKNNKKIGVISEAPSRTTGFGKTCKYIIDALVDTGYEVVCFGIGVFGETFERREANCRVWAVGNSNLVDSFRYFLDYERPSLIIINYEITSVQRWYAICREVGWNGPIIAYFVLDGLPINIDYLKVLSLIDKKITATRSVASYLQSLGYYDIRVAPHGVDKSIFEPLSNREELRFKLGLQNKFVIGVFGRNVDRKQHPRILMALQQLKELNLLKDVVVYFHCQPKDNPGFRGWNLIRLVENFGLSEYVIFPHDDFKQISGVPTRSFVHTRNINDLHFSNVIGYVERLNCCDVIINVPFCGGFELTIIEAQACGIPIINTDDEGIMREVVGDGGILLSAVDIGVWNTGAYQYFVSPKNIARSILELKEKPQLRKELSEKGIKNSNQYSWDLLKKTIVEAIQEVL